MPAFPRLIALAVIPSCGKCVNDRKMSLAVQEAGKPEVTALEDSVPGEVLTTHGQQLLAAATHGRRDEWLPSSPVMRALILIRVQLL